MNRRLHLAFFGAAALILLLAAGLRIHAIARRSLWYDEAMVANVSRGNFGETLALTRGEFSGPIVYPMVLYAVERVGSSPLAVRLPALLLSLLAVVMMLGFAAIPSVDPWAAALAALLLAVGAFQIRYAQEVREYSLSVFYAALLTFLFLRFTENRVRLTEDPRDPAEAPPSPAPLYIALFAAPLIQYGLVLFSGGILAALVILRLSQIRQPRPSRIGNLQILCATLSLCLGCLITYELTLRYQWGFDFSYLKDYFYARGDDLSHFAAWNTHNLLLFLLPGAGILWLSAASLAVYIFVSARARRLPPLAVLAFTTFAAVLAAGIVRAYPFGPTRQGLFLAPVVCLLAAASLVEAARRLPARFFAVALAAIAAVTLFSAERQDFRPYAEFEDIQTVLAGLESHVQPGDAVYLYGGAIPAVDFYLPRRDPRFLYGHDHHLAPEQYAREIEACVSGNSQTVWLVFSHVRPGEDRRTLRDLSTQWDVEPTLTAEKAWLYRARRRVLVAPSESAAADPPIAGSCSGESFWAWNERLMGQLHLPVSLKQITN